jgi:hypothetical protein
VNLVSISIKYKSMNIAWNLNGSFKPSVYRIGSVAQLLPISSTDFFFGD